MSRIAHWDDVEPERRTQPPMDAVWRDLGGAAGSVAVGARRIQIDPGGMPTPPHSHGAEEEIFYVLAGSGLSWQDGAAHDIAAGDCLVHLSGGPAHTLRGGPDGLDVIVFGMRERVEACILPRSGSAWLASSWTEVGGPDPWEREAELGPLEWPVPSPRPDSIVNLAAVPAREEPARKTVGRAIRDLGRAAGSVQSGLRHSAVEPGMLNVPPHCHSAEEELFVVLRGDGHLLLGDEEIPVRAGHVASRPAGTGVAHAFRGGGDGLDLLMYGTRDPRDITYYPRSDKVFLRGVGVVGRIQRLDYWDGEV
jgi:uncharacterized cupin superfamily protein